MTSVNIIMAVANRPNNLLNALKGWSLIDYPDFYFTIIDNATGNPEIKNIIMGFSDKLHIEFHQESQWTIMNKLWTQYGKASRADYVIFSMADEIISHKDIIQKMLNPDEYLESPLTEEQKKVSRASIFTYFMDDLQTKSLADLPWESDPTIIPVPYSPETSAGLISHITGNYKENWEWFGWFRELDGHLWLDQDVHLREVILHRWPHTPKNVYCLHQSHPPSGISLAPGFIYRTEKQARLLEPAERG